MDKLPELLAPAGELEIAKMALNAGADACYIGGHFSARAYAKNFDEKQIAEILRYAHLRGKKIYVAVNTMLFEREMREALKYTRRLYESGVDGVIAADIGYIRACHERFVNLPLHASTQLGISDADGAEFAREMGCKRVVAARETDLNGLALMAQTGVEIEAFCHGALCSGISGACLFSGFAGGRSGNRGRCAQPCRLAYSLDGKKEEYLLSTADLCALDLIPALMQAGVCSLKIEGRMKRAEYVTLTVDAYRRALDALQAGDFDMQAARLELQKIYNRGGFTEGYFRGNRDVTYTKRQNHMGVLVGKLEQAGDKSGLIATRERLQRGDGVEFVRGDQSIGGLTLSYADPTERGFRIPVVPGARGGDRVFRTTDAAQLSRAQKLGQDEFTLPIYLRLIAKTGEQAGLEAVCGDQSISVQGECCERAQKEIDVERLRQWLGQTGGTVFRAEQIELNLEGSPFLRAGEVKELRRAALEQLEQKLLKCAQPYRAEIRPGEDAPQRREQRGETFLSAQVHAPWQALAAWRAGADRILYDLGCDEKGLKELCKSAKEPVWLVLPVFWTREQADRVRKLWAGYPGLFAGVCAANPGQIAFARRMGIDYLADYWLNTSNTRAAQTLLAEGASSVCLSAELTVQEISQISCLPQEALVYGRVPIMNLRHCPVKKAGKCPDCGKLALEGRKGYRYPLFRSGVADCMLQVLNPVVMAMGDLPALRAAGVSGFRLLFHDETAEQVEEITGRYREAMQCGGQAEVRDIIAEKEVNTGHFFRGVL